MKLNQQLLNPIKKHLWFYYQLILFTFKAKMEYRVNFALQLLYGPAYILILFLIMQVVYSKTNNLIGWTKDEALLLFSVNHVLYTVSIMLFIGSVRDLVWSGLNLGKLDLIMTKPINTQFYATFGKPEIQQLALLAGVGILFIRQMMVLAPNISLINALAFALVWLSGIICNYLMLTTYATLAFYVTKAQQIIEIYDKFTDHAQYPTPIYPVSIQWLFTTVIPIALYGFIPTAVLLGKISWQTGILPLILIIPFYMINQFAWKRAIKAYSSASS